MAKNDLLNLFDLEGSYAGGGEFFKDGRYKIERAYFSMFDFNGKAKSGEECPALTLELQPKDDNGKDAGVMVPQFWPIRGDGIELANPIKGHKGEFASLKLTGQYDTLLKSGEFFMFMESLRVAGYAMDDYDNDITCLDDLDAIYGKKADPYDVQKRKEAADSGEKKKDAKKDYGPRMIVIVAELVKEKSSGKGGGKGGSSAAEPEAKGGKGGKSGKFDAASATAQELLLKFIETEMDGAKDGKEATTRPMMRMDIGKWITGEMDLDAEKGREVQGLVNDDDELSAALKSFGWKLDGKAITPPKG